MEFASGDPGKLTPEDVKEIIAIPGIECVTIGPHIPVDDYTLAEFANIESGWGYVTVANYATNPRQADIWNTVKAINALRGIGIDASSPLPEAFWRMLQNSSLNRVTVNAAPGRRDDPLLKKAAEYLPKCEIYLHSLPANS